MSEFLYFINHSMIAFFEQLKLYVRVSHYIHLIDLDNSFLSQNHKSVELLGRSSHCLEKH